MRFRPCIDIHNGKVKQIVGGTLADREDFARENFVAEQDAGFYADFYKKDHLTGGHIILLNPETSPFYEATRRQAFVALQRDPGHWQVGGGIHPENAKDFLDAGAAQVIVTSYVFRNGQLRMDHLDRMRECVGRERLVLDLSCRKKKDGYYIVTDRWQKFTDVRLTSEVMDELSGYCQEFLIHAVDVEGKASGPEVELIHMLGEWNGLPVTYAGGIGSFEDLDTIRRIGNHHVDVTIGSALDLYGGMIPYSKVIEYIG